MFQNSRRTKDSTTDGGDHSLNWIPITRTDGGSVSAIRQFMFGEKSSDGRRSNSLNQWKRNNLEVEPQVKLKSPSFRTPKKNFFQSWSKSIARYASTPDLNNGRQDNGCKGNEEFSVMPSVKKMVRELEKSASMVSRLPLSKMNRRTKRIPDAEHPEVCLKPDSESCHFLPSSPISSRQNNSFLKKAASLRNVQDDSVSSFGVSNPLYAELHHFQYNNIINDRSPHCDDGTNDFQNRSRESQLAQMSDSRFYSDKNNFFQKKTNKLLNKSRPLNSSDQKPWNSGIPAEEENFTCLLPNPEEGGGGGCLGHQSEQIDHSDDTIVGLKYFSNLLHTVEVDDVNFLNTVEVDDVTFLNTREVDDVNFLNTREVDDVNFLNTREVDDVNFLNTREVDDVNFLNTREVDEVNFLNTREVDNEVTVPDELLSTSGKTVVIQEPGRFLARWIHVEDLSSRDYDSAAEASGGASSTLSDVNINASICFEVFPEPAAPVEGNVKTGKMKRPAERRESGRFQSAARILRSLTRNRAEEDRKDTSSASLSRSNPHYHSEGKGNKKKKMEREAGSAAQKERSRSFCDKPEVKKKFSQQQENKMLRQEAKAKLDHAENMNSDTFVVRKLTESPSSSVLHDRSSSLPSSPNSSSLRNEESLASPNGYQPNACYSNEHQLEERGRINTQSAEECDKGFRALESTGVNQLERDKDRRSSRKLTKDSGYETSPYSEGDYANLDLFPMEGETSVKGIAEGKIIDANTEVVEALSTLLQDEISTSERAKEEEKCISSVSASSGNSRGDPSDSGCPEVSQNVSFSDKLSNLSPADSLTNFADSLIVSAPSASPSGSLIPAKSTPSLYHDANCVSAVQDALEEETDSVNGALHTSKSTPNLEGIVDEDETMVTNKSAYYLHGPGSPSVHMGTNRSAEKRYWNEVCSSEDAFNQTDYAHHLRSSSYQILHSRQLSAGSCHGRQHSNTSNYSEGDDVGYREEASFANTHQQPHANLADRSRCFSFDNLGYEAVNHSIPWNISEPDLSLTPPVTSSCSLSQKYEKGRISPSAPAVPLISKKSSPGNSKKLPPSPPPPPVRDASSLKYIRYGPGHEKFPSWPVPAGSSLVLSHAPQNHDGSMSGIPDSACGNYISPQGSHRSHSWTEQSEYPKEKCGGYARPYQKKQFSPSFQKQLLTVMEKCEKISPEVFMSRPPDDILKGPSYSLIDSYLHQSTYYPPFDREGRGIDDKDYSIPSPPERDPGMGEPHLSHMTAAQLEEHTRRCDFGYNEFPYTDFPQITPLLDQLRQESYTWDGSSERDSGRGESESVTDSRYSSNGRESVTTVVTNSSSASSSETLKWHGSLSDVSILSGQSRDAKGDHNIVHSARVQAPQRQNSESVQYYSTNGRGKHLNKYHEPRTGREGNYPRPYRDGKWSREVERSNEVNNLKKFPSYSYTQPLSQINEAPLAESREASLPSASRSQKSSAIDFSKPPSVAERINELERQSLTTTFSGNSFKWPRESIDTREANHYRDEQPRSLGSNNHEDSLIECDIKQVSNERDSRVDSLADSSCIEYSQSSNNFQSSLSPSVSNNQLYYSMRRDSDDSVLSSDSSHHSYGETDRSISSTSYTYLDPEKRCKVSDATLKNIQKQALLSFYERRTGKSFNAGSLSSSVSSMACSVSSNEAMSGDWTGKNHRSTRPCRGTAKLARVPNSELGVEQSGDVDRHGAKATRRRSVSGRELRDDSLMDSSSGTDAQMHLTKSPKMNFSSISSCHSESDQDTLPEVERRPSLSRVCHDISAPSSSTPEAKGDRFNLSTEEDLPPLPPSLEDTPPKPPDRPPKKINLRSLFHPASEDALPENTSPSSRPYFYKKPPAPDPPLTPPESPPPLSVNSDTSRSSTPDLPLPPPPPPPPVTEDAVVCDEPLPPPPQVEAPQDIVSLPSIFSGNQMEGEAPVVYTPPKPVYKETYHKDSYMAHRKDWKTGYEGRYRRTHSPTAPDRNGIHTTSRENLINLNNLKTSQSKPVNQPITSYHTNGNLRSALSTSSLVQRPSSPIDNVSFLSEKSNHNNNNNVSKRTKGWSPHVRQKSTTVNFTAEELRAFKARRAAQESMLSSTGDLNSLTSSPSPLRPLTRAFSMGEPFHIQSNDENRDVTAEDTNHVSLGSIPNNMMHSHDGPITAHPAQVTEETALTTSCPGKFIVPSLPPTSLSEDFTPSVVLKASQSSTSPPTSPVALSITSSTSSLASASSSSSSSSTLVSSRSISTASSTTVSAPVSTPLLSKVDYRRTLSSIGTCPSMTLTDLSTEETADRANVVVLTYGRTPKPEVVDCDKLSRDFVQIGNVDSRLQALLAPRPPYKSMANYMDGIFVLELRKDLLCGSHASHPDFNDLAHTRYDARCNGKTTESGDSLCFSSSESKLWTAAREAPFENDSDSSQNDSQFLNKKKEELMNSISRKLDILKEEQGIIQGEISQNLELGVRVTEQVESRAKPSEADKVKLHAEEIDKITSLLLGLSGRLARIENSLTLMKDEDSAEQKRILEVKRDKLSDQLEEAKKLKENIDRRAVQVCKILSKYLTEEEYSEYDHFVKMKAKLIMDAREMDDKIRVGEEQFQALQSYRSSL